MLMLHYVIYNTPLICTADPNNHNKCFVGFVDDTTLLARGKDFELTHNTIKNMMEHNNGIFNWSSNYSSPLEMNKLALVNFTQSPTKANNASILILNQ
jgi:hypothetical protein